MVVVQDLCRPQECREISTLVHAPRGYAADPCTTTAAGVVIAVTCSAATSRTSTYGEETLGQDGADTHAGPRTPPSRATLAVR